MNMHTFLILFGFIFLLNSCDQKPAETNNSLPETPSEFHPKLRFMRDSAYNHILTQTGFGPRIPGSAGHKACADWIRKELRGRCDTFYEQSFIARTFDGKSLPAINFIGSINPAAKRRVLLVAHWDTRPFCDQEEDGMQTPLIGADDGASGVAVLLEIARLMRGSNPQLGIDFLLVDAEDYGHTPRAAKTVYTEDSYCLGAQHWSKTPHLPGYRAQWGILLDMVGGRGNIFTREQNSVYYAAWLGDRVWAHAAALGFGSYFQQINTPPVTDDHYYINKIAGIPTIDIIGYSPIGNGGFPAHWHTRRDNPEVIDPAVLQAVGQTVLHTIEAEAVKK
jgi:hypothetical protein